MRERWLAPKEVALQIGFSHCTLQRWRANGDGPPFVVIGRSIRYSASDVEEWLRARAVEPRERRR